MSHQRLSSDEIRVREACAASLSLLLLYWSEASKEELPSELQGHLCSCRSCLRFWIALEAATELRSESSFAIHSDESRGIQDDEVQDVNFLP